MRPLIGTTEYSLPVIVEMEASGLSIIRIEFWKDSCVFNLEEPNRSFPFCLEGPLIFQFQGGYMWFTAFAHDDEENHKIFESMGI